MKRFEHAVSEGTHGRAVTVRPGGGSTDRLASRRPWAGLPSLLRPADGSLDILIAGRRDSVNDTNLSQQASSQALTQKLTLHGEDGHAAMNRLPGGRVARERRAVQVHIHLIEKAEKM